MTFYDTIFTRRSVRSYNKKPLDEPALNDLRTFLDEIKPMDGQTARFEIVGVDKVKNEIAPHYILAYCADNGGAYANVGYMLQNADLYLQSRGYGSLWLGMAKPNELSGDFCIMLAFGKTDVQPRKGTEDFKRLPVGDVSDADNAVAQAARLAPSAMNSQPWKLGFSDDKVTVHYQGRGVSQLVLRKKLSKIDMGIISRHIVVALQNEGKTVLSVTPVTNGKDFSTEINFK